MSKGRTKRVRGQTLQLLDKKYLQLPHNHRKVIATGDIIIIITVEYNGVCGKGRQNSVI